MCHTWFFPNTLSASKILHVTKFQCSGNGSAWKAMHITDFAKIKKYLYFPAALFTTR